MNIHILRAKNVFLFAVYKNEKENYINLYNNNMLRGLPQDKASMIKETW